MDFVSAYGLQEPPSTVIVLPRPVDSGGPPQAAFDLWTYRQKPICSWIPAEILLGVGSKQ